MARVRMVEGVPWYRFRVSFRLRIDGRWVRRQRITWSPGDPWIWSEVARWLDDAYGLDNIRDGSVRWEAV